VCSDWTNHGLHVVQQGDKEFPTRTLRRLLRRSAALLNHNGHAAIDATFFDRGHVSRHYAHRSERSIQTLKATFLVETAQNAVIDVHCSARWPVSCTESVVPNS
jgi:hypothetical protein